MKNLKKKGFTIVELVIVIAVIAILSAVLIPTFSNLIKKANLSNDQSFVRNANTTLAFEGALEKFENASDAIDALNRNGFSGKYNTYSTNFHYVYSLENNKMYLVNDENVVIYPEEEDITALWGLYTDNRTSVVEGITKYIAMTNITNSDHYNDVFANGTYTIDLNGYFIAVESDLTGVTANNGIVLGGAIQGEGSSSDYELVDYDGENIDSVQLSELGETVENEFVIKNKVFRKFVHTTDSNTNYVFENCIFYGDGVQFNDTNAANLGIYGTLKNCQFIDTQEGRWAVLSNISLNVIDCTFTNLNGRGAIQIQ